MQYVNNNELTKIEDFVRQNIHNDRVSENIIRHIREAFKLWALCQTSIAEVRQDDNHNGVISMYHHHQSLIFKDFEGFIAALTSSDLDASSAMVILRKFKEYTETARKEINKIIEQIGAAYLVPYPPQEYKTAAEDLALIIANETCGLEGAIPDQDDQDLANVFVKMINHGARYAVGREKFDQRIFVTLDSLEFEGNNGIHINPMTVSG